MTILKGWRYTAFIAGIVGTIGLALYPIIIDPMLNTDKYSKLTSSYEFLLDNL